MLGAVASTSYGQPLLARAREQQTEARRRARRARSLLPEVVEVLVRRYGARRVLLVGSLAEGRHSHRSDLDLVVEGLGLLEAIDAWNDACELTELPVDIIRAETLSPEWRRYHQRYGELLYAE